MQTAPTEFQSRQGDVFIYTAEVPDNLKPAKKEALGLVLAAGTATGHHHRIAPKFKTATLLRTEDGTRTYLRVTAPAKATAKLKPALAQAAEKARAVAAPLQVRLAELDAKNTGPTPSDIDTEIDALEAEIHTALEPDRIYRAAKREVDLANGAVLLTHDEHDEVVIPPGDYEVYIQREYQPDGVRQVQD